MVGKVMRFVKKDISLFFSEIVSFTFFLPYFFSVLTLSRTLFAPWKNMVVFRTVRRFSLTHLVQQQFLNLTSRLIGATMRASVLFFYCLVQMVFLIVLPLVVLLYLLVLPLRAFVSSFLPSESEIQQKAYDRFIRTHLLEQKNAEIVTRWFKKLYTSAANRAQWWTWENLKRIPPLARDWAYGYTPTLDTYSFDLASQQYQSSERYIFGRASELTEIERGLSRPEQNNVLIVGDPGVGKHTVVDALARKVYEGTIVPNLAYHRILELNMEKILASSPDHMMRVELFEELIAEAIAAKNVIVVIEHIDRYMVGGAGRVDLSVPIEKLARSAHICLIGLTTTTSFEQYLRPNEKIASLFSVIMLPEINTQQALEMMMDIAPSYELRYKCFLPYETLLNVVEKSEYYLSTIPFPEKSIDLLNQTCQRLRSTHKAHHWITVMPVNVDETITAMTHIPTQLTAQLKNRLLHMEELLHERVLNQEEAVSQVAAALRRAFILLGKRKKPLASLLFLGPTGVGKTEMAKTLAFQFFGSESALIRFDMSMYQTTASVEQLVGSADAHTPGILTTSIREKPYGVLLLDELEKAHPNLLNIFLTLLDEGYIPDGQAKKVDAKSLIVVATSNAGVDFLAKKRNILRSLEKGTDSTTQDTHASEELLQYLTDQHVFTPEFLNRFDSIITFSALETEDATQIAKALITNIAREISAQYRIQIQVSDETIAALIRDHYNPAFGARNLQRIIALHIEDALAKRLLAGTIAEGETLHV